MQHYIRNEMEYDPNNLTEQKNATHIDKKQEKLTEFNPMMHLSEMKFIVTLRNATNYYEYKGSIYGCSMSGAWYLESTDADAWMRRIKSSQIPITSKEREHTKMNVCSMSVMHESLAIHGSLTFI